MACVGIGVGATVTVGGAVAGGAVTVGAVTGAAVTTEAGLAVGAELGASDDAIGVEIVTDADTVDVGRSEIVVIRVAEDFGVTAVATLSRRADGG